MPHPINQKFHPPLPAIARLCELATSDISAEEAAREVKLPKRVVRPILDGLRKGNQYAADEMGKRDQYVQDEAAKAYCAPGPDVFPSVRKPNGHIDWDQVHGYERDPIQARPDYETNVRQAKPLKSALVPA